MVETKKFYKERFAVISEEKREQILSAAISEFAQNGFNGTSINKVAKRAKISIGAMYSYFESKDDLFLTVVEKLFHVLEMVLEGVDEKRDIFEMIEELFYRGHHYAVTYPEMNQIYLDFSTESLSSLSSKVSKKLETITLNKYVSVIERDKKKGIIDSTLDTGVLSFIVDNILMMYQFSFASEYYKERMKLFIGDKLYENEKVQIEEIMKIIRKSMAQV